MQSLVLVAVLAMATFSYATTLTYRMAPHERACFYAIANKVEEKVAFYFAVRILFFLMIASCENITMPYINVHLQ